MMVCVCFLYYSYYILLYIKYIYLTGDCDIFLPVTTLCMCVHVACMKPLDSEIRITCGGAICGLDSQLYLKHTSTYKIHICL